MIKANIDCMFLLLYAKLHDEYFTNILSYTVSPTIYGQQGSH